MQQTDKYKLNLIEREDVFSPDALNENAEKVEAALGTKTDAADTAALEQRVVQLEAHKCYVGSYVGDNTPSREINLGFTPKLLILSNDSGGLLRSMFEGIVIKSTFGENILCVTENGFHVGHATYSTFNNTGATYYFLALA